MTQNIKFEIIKTRVNAPVRTLKAQWVWEEPKKEIRIGRDRLHRLYAVLENYTSLDWNEIEQWLNKCCGDRWCSLGQTIWFDREADRTLFLMKWS